MSYVAGTGLTRYGRHEGRSTLDLMSEAATRALQDAGLERKDIDGLVCGYSTTMPHIMLATVFAEHYGLHPHYAHAMQMGGARRGSTGASRSTVSQPSGPIFISAIWITVR